MIAWTATREYVVLNITYPREKREKKKSFLTFNFAEWTCSNGAYDIILSNCKSVAITVGDVAHRIGICMLEYVGEINEINEKKNIMFLFRLNK